MRNAVIERMEQRIHEMKSLNTNKCTLFESFQRDFERAMQFYRNARTGSGKIIPGEEERKANAYANLILGFSYLSVAQFVPSNYTGMQKLAMLAQMEELVIKKTA